MSGFGAAPFIVFVSTVFATATAVGSKAVDTSGISRVKLSVHGEDFCLVPRSSECAGAEGRIDNPSCVHLLKCALVNRQENHLGENIRDLWRLDSNGLLISHASGNCLSTGTPHMYSKCMPQDRWYLSDGGLLSFHHQLCLSPRLSSSATSESYELELTECDKRQGTWWMEQGTLVVYPVPDASWEAYGSPKYNVTVEQNGQSIQAFVYYSTEDGHGNSPPFPPSPPPSNSRRRSKPPSPAPPPSPPAVPKSASYLTFSFQGEVKVTVTKLTGAFNEAKVRPSSLNIRPYKASSSSVSFTLTKPNSKISVEFDNDWDTDSLLIFADPLETNIPPVHGSNVVYYGVGSHNVNLELTSNKQVYVAGGAFLFAQDTSKPIFSTSTNSGLGGISIRGRGVVSGKLSESGVYLVTLCGSHHEVEGITILDANSQSHLQINAPWYCSAWWSGTATGARIDNVKVFGWTFADGIYAGKGSHVSNVFTKVNDDGVKPFEGDSLYEKLTLWQQQNGWAIMLSWQTQGLQSNITVKDVTVIHDGHNADWSVPGCDPCTPNQATIGAVHGGSGKVTNVLLENIVLETRVWRPIWFGIDKSKWATEGTGILDGWTLKSLYVNGGAQVDSQVYGSSNKAQVANIKFEDVHFQTTHATSLQGAHIDVLGATQNVQLSYGQTLSALSQSSPLHVVV